jgi:hypothetical protein
MDHRIGGLEQIGRIVQSPLQIDLAHLHLRAAAPWGAATE